MNDILSLEKSASSRNSDLSAKNINGQLGAKPQQVLYIWGNAPTAAKLVQCCYRCESETINFMEEKQNGI